MKRKLYNLLTENGASVRLIHCLWRHNKVFTVGNITIGQFLRDWPLERLRKDLFGFGPTMLQELITVLGACRVALYSNRALRTKEIAEDIAFGIYLNRLLKPKLGRVATALRTVEAIEELRGTPGSGDSITIVCDNDEPPPVVHIEAHAAWTDWKDREFSGDTLLDCLTQAVRAKRKATQ